nr:hypothetical protein [Borrelia hermsii]
MVKKENYMKRIGVLLFTLCVLYMLCVLSILSCKQEVDNQPGKKRDAAQLEVVQPRSRSRVVTPPRRNVHLPPPVPSLTKGEKGDDVQGIVNREPPSPEDDVKIVKIETAEQAYKLLSDRVVKYEAKLSGEHDAFAEEKYLYGILYDIVSPVFEDPYKKDEVFAALGHDVKALEALDNILDLLVDPDKNTYNFVLYKLFRDCREITEFTEQVLSEILDEDGLAKIKSKGMNAMLNVYANLEQFISTRESVISKLKEQIILAAASTDAKFVTDKLNGIVEHKTEIQIGILAMMSLKIAIRKAVNAH